MAGTVRPAIVVATAGDTGSAPALAVQGDWVLANASDIAGELERLPPTPAMSRIESSRLSALDTAGAGLLMELADRVEVLQVEALCWCGARATHNARTIGGVMVVEGAQVVVGDVNHSTDDIGYEVLCRRHHRRRLTAATSRAAVLSPDVLPVSST